MPLFFFISNLFLETRAEIQKHFCSYFGANLNFKICFRDLLTFSETYHRRRSCQNTSLCIMVMQKEAYITLCRDVFRRHNATLLRHSEKNFILNYIVQFVITFFFKRWFGQFMPSDDIFFSSLKYEFRQNVMNETCRYFSYCLIMSRLSIKNKLKST